MTIFEHSSGFSDGKRLEVSHGDEYLTVLSLSLSLSRKKKKKNTKAKTKLHERREISFGKPKGTVMIWQEQRGVFEEKRNLNHLIFDKRERMAGMRFIYLVCFGE